MQAFSKMCRKQIVSPFLDPEAWIQSMFPLHHGSTTKDRPCNVNHVMLFYKAKLNVSIWNVGRNWK